MELKKFFLAFMLIVVTIAGFNSCDKNVSESETHSQSFTLGETSYAIDNAFTVENINDSHGNIYNAVVLGQGQIIGNAGEGKAVILVFKGDIQPGTYTMSYNSMNPTSNYPKYYFIQIKVEDIVNFSLDDLMTQDGYYVANDGSFTLEKDGDVFTITTDGIEVENINDAAVVETSSVDLESDLLSYVLPTIEEGNVDGVNIVFSGILKMKIEFLDMYCLAFLTAYGDVFGFTLPASYINGIPEDAYSFVNHMIIYFSLTDITTVKYARCEGEVRVTRDNNIYNIDMKDLVFSNRDIKISRLHYVGEMLYYDFQIPFLDENP